MIKKNLNKKDRNPEGLSQIDRNALLTTIQSLKTSFEDANKVIETVKKENEKLSSYIDYLKKEKEKLEKNVLGNSQREQDFEKTEKEMFYLKGQLSVFEKVLSTGSIPISKSIKPQVDEDSKEDTPVSVKQITFEEIFAKSNQIKEAANNSDSPIFENELEMDIEEFKKRNPYLISHPS